MEVECEDSDTVCNYSFLSNVEKINQKFWSLNILIFANITPFLY
jgi:hypothetical protein